MAAATRLPRPGGGWGSRMRSALNLVASQTVNKLMESLPEVYFPDIHGKLCPLRSPKRTGRGRPPLAPCAVTRLSLSDVCHDL